MLSIKFTDGEIIQEPNLNWNSLPNKTIRYLDYKIGNKTIRLMGYNKYLRLKEMAQGVNIKLTGIIKIILVGQIADICDKVTIDLINKKISTEQVPFDIIYHNRPIDDKFWRIGQVSDNPNVFINHGS